MVIALILLILIQMPEMLKHHKYLPEVNFIVRHIGEDKKQGIEPCFLVDFIDFVLYFIRTITFCYGVRLQGEKQ